MTDWKPSPSDIDWQKNMLKMVAENGMWANSAGIYRVCHKDKTLTLTVKSPIFDLPDVKEMHERIVVACKECGYTVKIQE
jgi:hypothetical protein